MGNREGMEAIARGWVDAYNNKDYARLAELLAPDLVLEDVGMGLIMHGAGTFVDGIREVAESAAPDRKLQFDRIYVDGETIVCEGGWSGTFRVEKWGNPPGTHHTHRSCTVLQTRDGRIVSFKDYTCGESNEPAGGDGE